MLSAVSAAGAGAGARAAARRPSLSARRLLSDERRPSYARLMDFPPLVFPSFVLSVKNWFFTTFVIRPHMDPEFDINQFMDGSKKAVEVISSLLSESKFENLRGLVTDDAYNELYQNVTHMSVAEREDLAISRDDMYLSFPYQIGVMFEDDKRWVEITMCYHLLKGLKELKARGLDTFGMGVEPDFRTSIQFCNYRFIREYTKDVEDSSWIVNVVNHFKENDLRKE